MDAIKLMTDDHRSFRSLLERYQAAQSQRLRGDVAMRLLHEIRLHIRLEEKYVYPIAQERSGAQLDDHVQGKQSIEELLKLELSDRRFGPKLVEVVEEVLRHSDEEERLFFPPLRKSMRRSELEALGRVIQNAREALPEQPAGTLLSRVVSHVLAAWKVQLGDAFERALGLAQK